MCQLPFKEGVGTYLQLLCSYSIDQNLITWPLLAAREVGSTIWIATCPGQNQGSSLLEKKGRGIGNNNSDRDSVCLDVVPSPTGFRKDAHSRDF